MGTRGIETARMRQNHRADLLIRSHQQDDDLGHLWYRQFDVIVLNG